MNFGEIRSRVAYRLGFKSTSADQDFAGPSTDTWRHIDNAINEARRQEIHLAQLEAGHRWLERNMETTWPASQLLLTLPGSLGDASLVRIFDITANSGMGDPIFFGDQQGTGAIVFRDRKTLEWRDAGPSSAVTLRIHYVPQAEDFTETSEECDIIPPRHHDLYVVSAAVRLREVADESAPQAWVQHRNELRFLLWKELSQTRPLGTGPARAKTSVVDSW